MINPFLAGVLFLILLGAGVPTSLWAQPATASSNSNTNETETTWPGIKFEIAAVKRLDPKHILIAVHIVADDEVKEAVLIGIPDDDEKNSLPGPKGAKIVKPPKLFSLISSSVTDEESQIQMKADSTVPNQPFLGPNAILTSLIAKQWVQLSVQFALPAPPAGEDGLVPVQKIDITLPKARGPIKGMVVPPLSTPAKP